MNVKKNSIPVNKFVSIPMVHMFVIVMRDTCLGEMLLDAEVK